MPGAYVIKRAYRSKSILVVVCRIILAIHDGSSPRIAKIFELAFLLEVTPPPIAEHQLVFWPLVTDTDR